jgi:hypothetical protein
MIACSVTIIAITHIGNLTPLRKNREEPSLLKIIIPSSDFKIKAWNARFWATKYQDATGNNIHSYATFSSERQSQRPSADNVIVYESNDTTLDYSRVS